MRSAESGVLSTIITVAIKEQLVFDARDWGKGWRWILMGGIIVYGLGKTDSTPFALSPSGARIDGYDV